MAVDSSSVTDTGERLPEAVVTELLDHPHRRTVLRSLAHYDDPITVRRLAAHVVARERSIHPDAVPPRDRARARRRLNERHIPKLTATGVVEYNPRHASVELGETAPQLLDRLDTIEPTH